MSDTPWTPGPWHAAGVYETDNSETPHTYFVMQRDTRRAVVKPADARLIAKAPEMAELLERFITEKYEGEHEGYPTYVMPVGAHNDAVALLADIKGDRVGT